MQLDEELSAFPPELVRVIEQQLLSQQQQQQSMMFGGGGALADSMQQTADGEWAAAAAQRGAPPFAAQAVSLSQLLLSPTKGQRKGQGIIASAVAAPALTEAQALMLGAALEMRRAARERDRRIEARRSGAGRSPRSPHRDSMRHLPPPPHPARMGRAAAAAVAAAEVKRQMERLSPARSRVIRTQPPVSPRGGLHPERWFQAEGGGGNGGGGVGEPWVPPGPNPHHRSMSPPLTRTGAGGREERGWSRSRSHSPPQASLHRQAVPQVPPVLPARPLVTAARPALPEQGQCGSTFSVQGRLQQQHQGPPLGSDADGRRRAAIAAVAESLGRLSCVAPSGEAGSSQVTAAAQQAQLAPSQHLLMLVASETRSFRETADSDSSSITVSLADLSGLSKMPRQLQPSAAQPAPDPVGLEAPWQPQPSAAHTQPAPGPVGLTAGPSRLPLPPREPGHASQWTGVLPASRLPQQQAAAVPVSPMTAARRLVFGAAVPPRGRDGHPSSLWPESSEDSSIGFPAAPVMQPSLGAAERHRSSGTLVPPPGRRTGAVSGGRGGVGIKGTAAVAPSGSLNYRAPTVASTLRGGSGWHGGSYEAAAGAAAAVAGSGRRPDDRHPTFSWNIMGRGGSGDGGRGGDSDGSSSSPGSSSVGALEGGGRAGGEGRRGVQRRGECEEVICPSGRRRQKSAVSVEAAMGDFYAAQLARRVLLHLARAALQSRGRDRVAGSR